MSSVWCRAFWKNTMCCHVNYVTIRLKFDHLFFCILPFWDITTFFFWESVMYFFSDQKCFDVLSDLMTSTPWWMSCDLIRTFWCQRAWYETTKALQYSGGYRKLQWQIWKRTLSKLHLISIVSVKTISVPSAIKLQKNVSRTDDVTVSTAFVDDIAKLSVWCIRYDIYLDHVLCKRDGTRDQTHGHSHGVTNRGNILLAEIASSISYATADCRSKLISWSCTCYVSARSHARYTTYLFVGRSRNESRPFITFPNLLSWVLSFWKRRSLILSGRSPILHNRFYDDASISTNKLSKIHDSLFLHYDCFFDIVKEPMSPETSYVSEERWTSFAIMMITSKWIVLTMRLILSLIHVDLLYSRLKNIDYHRIKRQYGCRRFRMFAQNIEISMQILNTSVVLLRIDVIDTLGANSLRIIKNGFVVIIVVSVFCIIIFVIFALFSYVTWVWSISSR